MIDYLNKFNELPSDLKDAVSGPEAVAAITELEAKYGVSLATTVMRVMVRDISLVDLPKFFVFEHSLDAKTAEELVEELKSRVLYGAAEYLGFVPETKANVLADGAAPVREPSANELEGWLNERQAATAVRGSSFFFSPEDEEEVRNLAMKLSLGAPAPRPAGPGAPAGPVAPAALETDKRSQEAADRAVGELKFNFSSSDLNSRFRQILYTFIKGIRNRVDAKQTLMKDVEVGGLGLNNTFADKALDTAQRIMIECQNAPLEPLKEEGTREEPVEAPAAAKPELFQERDLPYDFTKLKEDGPAPQPKEADREKAEPIAVGDKVIDLSKAEIKAPIPAKPAQKPAQTPAPAKEPPLAPAAKQALLEELSKTETVKAVSASAGAPAAAGKRKVQDVKYVPKLMGPVDELRDMDLVNFRRLSPDPRNAAAKIKEKLAFLEEDNYGQRLAGIKAWRESPANRQYLAIGRASIEQGQSVDTVIKAARDEGRDCLTKQEFVAIMDLNKELRF